MAETSKVWSAVLNISARFLYVNIFQVPIFVIFSQIIFELLKVCKLIFPALF